MGSISSKNITISPDIGNSVITTNNAINDARYDIATQTDRIVANISFAKHTERLKTFFIELKKGNQEKALMIIINLFKSTQDYLDSLPINENIHKSIEFLESLSGAYQAILGNQIEIDPTTLGYIEDFINKLTNKISENITRLGNKSDEKKLFGRYSKERLSRFLDVHMLEKYIGIFLGVCHTYLIDDQNSDANFSRLDEILRIQHELILSRPELKNGNTNFFHKILEKLIEFANEIGSSDITGKYRERLVLMVRRFQYYAVMIDENDYFLTETNNLLNDLRTKSRINI